jgi:serine/threonine protein kinase
MDGISPIDAFLTGRLSEDELLAEVERVIAQGSEADRTFLVSDWRTKSGRIRASEIRRKLDARVQPLTWFTSNLEHAVDTSKPNRPLQQGDVLANRFVIDMVIGSGGMGTVFKARDLRREEAQDRHPYVAIKTLNADVLQRGDSLKILQREARKAQSLSHPNIVRIFDFDRDQNTLFITMELLEGNSLGEIIQTNGLLGSTYAKLLPILTQVVSALQFAHAEGIVHSDLKPANILILPNGRVKVIDFGIARAIPIPNQQTIDRTTFDLHALGAMTPAYASPEMIEGRDADPRDDVFALACIIYEFLTGRHPFGRAPASVARAGNFSPREPEGLSPSQWKALQAGLHFDRSKRTPSVERLLAELSTKDDPARSYRRTKFAVGVSVAITVIGLSVYSIENSDLIKGVWLRAFDPSQQPPNESALNLTQQKAAEDAAQKLAQQKVTDEAAQRLAQQKAAEDAAQKLAQQKVTDEAAQRLAQQKAAEDAAQKLAQQKVTDEAAQRLAQQKAAEDAAQKLAQQKAAEDAAQKLAQQKAAEDAAQKLALPTPGQIGPPQIAEAQQLLTSMGLNTGSADGKAGVRTQEMLRAYQLTIGAPLTGMLTMALLESMRNTAPPMMARAKSLFSLAAEARHSGRSNDAIRLYEAALKMAPTDTEGFLALGDLQRDRSDYNTARHDYEIVLRAGGPAADIARNRIASLPVQDAQPPPTTDALAPNINHNRPQEQEPAGLNSTASRTANAGNGDTGITINAPKPSVSDRRQFDGVYKGIAQLTNGRNVPSCMPSSFPYQMTVNDNTVSYTPKQSPTITLSVENDGSFSGHGRLGLAASPPIVVSLSGRIQDGRLEADRTDPWCSWHLSLVK